MKGMILDFSIPESAGLITGDDGGRYRFEGTDWKSQATQPRPGVRVDFLGSDGTASEVYVDPTAPGGSGTWGASASRASFAAQGLDDRYRGLYRSSDEGVLLGLCAGVGHKFDAPVGVVRLAVVIAAFFVFGFLYFAGIFVPAVPTRGVPHPR